MEKAVNETLPLSEKVHTSEVLVKYILEIISYIIDYLTKLKFQNNKSYKYITNENKL